MTQWAPFVAAATLVTLLLLVLAYRSQSLVSDSLDGDDCERAIESTRLGEPVSAGQADGEPRGLQRWRPDDALGEPRARRNLQGAQSRDIELTPRLMLANVLVTQGLLAVVVLAGVWYFSIPGDAIGVTSNPWTGGLPAVAIGVGFGLALWAGNELAAGLAAAVGASYDETVRSLLAPSSRRGWVVLFGAALPTIAVAEELLFRAALVGVPAAGYDISPWVLVVVSSVAFAFGHGAQGRVGIVVTGALGLVLGAGYVLSESLLVVIVAHYVVNAMEFYIHEYHGLPDLSAARTDMPGVP